ncbi:MAG: hypothetical protein KatS3mg111_1103 [Pirellulaceae bacterium]|nr:MAG: hypothetical protein KatS3mg111_1103 [Pirellulaceae bacterium]
MQQHGPWKILRSAVVYEDPWLQVTRDEVLRPDGDPGSYATVQLKSGVCVVARDVDGNLHLTREFHYAVGRYTIEGVSGGCEVGESPLQTARRELAEELGIEADRWIHLGTIDPFTASIRSTVDLFLAEELRTCPTAPEGTECIEPVVMAAHQALAAVRDGQITHSPTCVLILRLALDFPTPA